jgi:uncharacterized protein (TIGR02598 family)
MPPFHPRKVASSSDGFSLVEVAMALGIVAFAFTALLGMLPVGLGLFRSAMDTSIATRIVQSVSSDLQQADFDALGTTTTGVLYFDEQGNAVSSPDQAIYWAKVNVFLQAVLPGSDAVTSSDIARVVIQVAHNPGAKVPSAGSDGTWQDQDGIRLIKRSVFLARNTPTGV